MSKFAGNTFPFMPYRNFYRQMQSRPAVWRDADLQALRLANTDPATDTIALAVGPGETGCEVVPGMAMSMQWINPGEQMQTHKHSWWHLFFIQSGHGTVTLQDPDSGLPEVTVLAPGDWVLVPAGITHRFDNSSASAPLVMMNINNLPQQALLSSFSVENTDTATG
ncbi:cupin domain-containing protein [Amantichitinum ursilacus]|uniref:5-nitrosalicylic acid 1,2-dioxygenase n=1 Tax=Amantichitinum ursilacus TaxID=857265 RepID=A0A0N0XIH5_9NEIS|nr:cupin domain-containing protein [Amantichitinum ursilacus]KPC52716.1 5-nitrosalicylic acid 1,2-dioxygenase [Amantichitinum ursilacus]